LVEDGAELHGHVEITRGDRLPKNTQRNVTASSSVNSQAGSAKDSAKTVNVPSREPAAIA
jgi:hypothetical protein